MTHVTIELSTLRNLVYESLQLNSLIHAGVDNWEQYEFAEPISDTDIKGALSSISIQTPEWSNTLPSEETPDVLLHWIDDGQHKYCLGTFAKDNEGVMQFYDNENNELSFIPVNDAWIQITPPEGAVVSESYGTIRNV